nr:type VI secretion system tip protein TssI/VgrG [Pseudomonas sp. MF7453]
MATGGCPPLVRYVHGLVSLFQQGDTGFRRTRYTAVVEPNLARFNLRSNWRIFQSQTVPDIITSMLAEQKLTDIRSEICFEHQPREYCVQAGETDLDFIARLAAEECCDEGGRVKVQFTWDRSDKNNDQSRCWMRVAHGWTGATWGAMALPRVDQELIISFLDGDPDQPITTGRNYRVTNLPPYELPKHKTRITIKSRTHKSDGFNELRFEDELGHQEVLIHAKK